MSEVTFWDVTVDLNDADRHTVRGLTQTQSIELLEIFDGAGLPATAIEYTENREPTGKKQAVQGGVIDD